MPLNLTTEQLKKITELGSNKDYAGMYRYIGALSED